jgi:hypothetical protein
MSTGLAHYPIFGIDIVVIIGATALILFIFVAFINSVNRLVLKKRNMNISPYWHHWIAILAIVLVIIHVIIQYIKF